MFLPGESGNPDAENFLKNMDSCFRRNDRKCRDCRIIEQGLIMRFSERMGKKPVKTEFQIKSMDTDLRTSLWNAFVLFVLNKVDSQFISTSKFNIFFTILWWDFFKWPVDGMDDFFALTRETIRRWFFKSEWYEVYDFIEFVSKRASSTVADGSGIDTKWFRKFCNDMLERELSGYRFVGDIISPITDEKELKEIEEAIEKSGKTKLSGVNSHLKSALSKLSDRKAPDYRNSVKESISAVEAICRVITGNPKATLGDALKIIGEHIEIHGALKEGFIKIYGYTSDEEGIRHAMLEESKVDFEDAKYMLVSCSAFINYLIMKAEKAGIRF